MDHVRNKDLVTCSLFLIFDAKFLGQESAIASVSAYLTQGPRGSLEAGFIRPEGEMLTRSVSTYGTDLTAWLLKFRAEAVVERG